MSKIHLRSARNRNVMSKYPTAHSLTSLRWRQVAVMTSRITGQSSVCSTVCLHWQWKNIKGLVTGGFPAQRNSNAENASFWWRHNVAMWGYRSHILYQLAKECFQKKSCIQCATKLITLRKWSEPKFVNPENNDICMPLYRSLWIASEWTLEASGYPGGWAQWWPFDDKAISAAAYSKTWNM